MSCCFIPVFNPQILGDTKSHVPSLPNKWQQLILYTAVDNLTDIPVHGIQRPQTVLHQLEICYHVHASLERACRRKLCKPDDRAWCCQIVLIINRPSKAIPAWQDDVARVPEGWIRAAFEVDDVVRKRCAEDWNRVEQIDLVARGVSGTFGQVGTDRVKVDGYWILGKGRLSSAQIRGIGDGKEEGYDYETEAHSSLDEK